jgi:PAS domain S-box-containing protein
MRRSSLAGAHATAPANAPDGSPDARPALTVVPSAANVVPFRSAVPATEPKAPALSPIERNAFHELARQLTARLKGEEKDDAQQRAAEPPAEATGTDAAESVAATPPAAEVVAVAAPVDEAAAAPDEAAQPAAPTAAESVAEAPEAVAPDAAAAEAAAAEPVTDIEPERREPTERPLLDRIPVGVLVYRLDTLLYANRAFLEWTGYDHLDALAEAGGLDSLFVEGGGANTDAAGGAARTLAIATPRGDKRPVEGRLFSVPWDGESALVLMLVTTPVDDRLQTTEASLQTTAAALQTTTSALQTAETALRLADAQGRELKAILDTATDGVVVIDQDGRIASANRSAEALFGYEAAELTALGFADLFAPQSRAAALDYLANLARGGVAGLIGDGREFTGQVRQGGTITLFMTLGRIADDSARVCAVFRDITPWKKTENDLIAARQEAERASAAKSEFLAKISHEIRTPLNSIVGFSEVMLEERFGPIGNERYRDYLKDIRSSGDHVVALLNDMLDLSKIEAGKLDLDLASLNLNELVQSCITLMQPQANRERIIIRSSLSPSLQPVVADARSVRQIVLNLLSNSVKFTGAGGQVIVSTAQSADGEVVLRVRDTGIGMDDKELSVALEPYRQLATATRWGSAGTGLGLPLTKALVEANRARFTITSKVNDGTLVEVAFAATRVPAV